MTRTKRQNRAEVKEKGTTEKEQSKQTTEKRTADDTVVKKTKKPRDDSLDFEIKPNDPKWMTVDIKRLTRTRSQAYLLRWIQDCVSEAKINNTEVKITPFPHDHNSLSSIKILAPSQLTGDEKLEFDKFMVTFKWNEVTRFMTMWSQNPHRIPIDYASPTQDPTSPDVIFVISPEVIKLAHKEFSDAQLKRKQIAAAKSKKKYEQKKSEMKNNLRQIGEWKQIHEQTTKPKSAEQRAAEKAQQEAKTQVEVETQKEIVEGTKTDKEDSKKEKKASKKDKKDKVTMTDEQDVVIEEKPKKEQKEKKEKKDKKAEAKEEEQLVQLPPPEPITKSKKESKKVEQVVETKQSAEDDKKKRKTMAEMKPTDKPHEVEAHQLPEKVKKTKVQKKND
jgi:hypothetical protein